MMKPQSLILLISISVLAACQPKQSTQSNTKSPKETANEQICYSYTKNRDTASLMMMTSGHIVTGELNYRLYEKDRNHGMIKGEMRGDTLLAEYTFNSEGSESVRQVVFLKKDGKLLEGFGEMIEKDGKMVFKNLSTLKFGEAIEFVKIGCN